MTHQTRADRDAELWALDQMSREAAQNRTESDQQPVEAPSGVGTAEGAREARYAEAIWGSHWSPQDLGLPEIADVIAVADAEVAAAVTEAQAEVEAMRVAARSWAVDARRQCERAESAEAEVERLREVAEGRVLHLFLGGCPDELDGFDRRDPNCPACRALLAPSPAATTGACTCGAWDSSHCDCPAPVSSGTHTRTETEDGPDFCHECSEAAQEWVPWPCLSTVDR